MIRIKSIVLAAALILLVATLYWLDRPSEESVRVTPVISGGAA